jgi:transcriptional regulator with XRE-family HTH domain
VGATIRRLRLERGLTQEQLAEGASIDRTVLVAVESGRRSVLYERLFDIADALGVPVTDLVREH